MESSSGPIIPWTVFWRNIVWKFYSSGILWCVNLLSGCITSDSFETLASTLRFTKGQLHHQMSFQLTGSLKNYRTKSPEANSLMDFIFKTTPLMFGSQNTQLILHSNSRCYQICNTFPHTQRPTPPHAHMAFVSISGWFFTSKSFCFIMSSLLHKSFSDYRSMKW